MTSTRSASKDGSGSPLCPRSRRWQVKGGETELTGFLEDSSALFGVLAEIEALGLELLELRQIPTGPKSP